MTQGTHELTDEQSDEMFERFGLRYRHVQTGDSHHANRADRRRGHTLSPAGYKVQLARRLDERLPRDSPLANLTAVTDKAKRLVRRKAA